MPIERYHNSPIYEVDELTGDPPVETDNRKYYSNYREDRWYCSGIQETGPHKSVILGCAIYKDDDKATAEKRLKELRKNALPDHSFELVHLDPYQQYNASFEWGPIRMTVTKTHCVDDGRQCR